MTYTCKRCGDTDTAESFAQIMERNKLCTRCINPKTQLSLVAIKKRNRTYKVPELVKTQKNHPKKEKQVRVPKERVVYEEPCEHCGTLFKSHVCTVRFCKAPECVKIGAKIRKLEREAAAINRLAKMAQITVYGANQNKMQKYINDKSRKHIDQS